jgi:sporulation protein YlmC with PRC-barrel domain
MADRDNPDFLSADSIKKDKVINEAGDNIGKIEELMIDLDNRRVAYAVLSFGGFLGMGDKLFAIPWQALSLRLHEHAFTLNVPKDVLQNAEGFDKDNWPVTRDELSRTYTYYGYQPYWQTGVTEQARQAGTSTGPQGTIESQGPARPGSTASRDNPDFLSADSIKSDKIVNRSGDKVGKIEELMIDLQDGKVAYVVLSHGGFLGIGHKLFAIPWQALTLRVHEHAFLLDIPKETLDKAEGFDKDKWPLTRDELSRTYTYYGYQPYWQTGAVTGAAAAAAVAGTSTGMQGETEAERKARQERERTQTERQTAVPREPEAEGVSRVERERQTAASKETVSKKVTRTETEIREPAETEAERKAKQERERLEALKGTEEEKVSQLEKLRMEKERQAQAERECLARLEREQVEAEKQANAERDKLARLERDLQEATRREKTEEVTRLEKEMREVKIQEETQRDRVTQLERERTEVERQAQAERDKLAQLERESTEKGRQTETEKERLARLERERTEAERHAQTERENLTQMERERTEAERREKAEPQRMARMGGMEGRGAPDFLPAGTIKGYKVINTNGDNLGRVEDLMIDLNNGRVAYAALSLGGFMGMSDKLFAVPWQALSFIPNEQAFILAVPRNILEKAEGFDKDKCPTTREQLSRTYTHYGYMPYWETGEARYGGRLETAEELMAGQDKEEIEEREKKETDPEKKARLERDKMIAERREHKYD